MKVLEYVVNGMRDARGKGGGVKQNTTDVRTASPDDNVTVNAANVEGQRARRTRKARGGDGEDMSPPAKKPRGKKT